MGSRKAAKESYEISEDLVLHLDKYRSMLQKHMPELQQLLFLKIKVRKLHPLELNEGRRLLHLPSSLSMRNLIKPLEEYVPPSC